MATTASDGARAGPHRFRHRAMGGAFEVRAAEADEQAARRAAEAAFDELDRIEKALSFFQPYGDVGQINVAAVGQTLRVGLDAGRCLAIARQLWADTDGAFDVTVGAALRAEGPPPRVGMAQLEIDESQHTVRKLAGVQVDLGGIGKGYALDRMAEVLREWDVPSALLHGGASTVLAVGPARWRVALRDPADEDAPALGHVVLRGAAFSGSSTFHAAHIADGRTGQRIDADRAAWALAPTAAEADALSTAFCVLGPQQVQAVCGRRPELSAILPARQNARWRLVELGRPVLSAARRLARGSEGAGR